MIYDQNSPSCLTSRMGGKAKNLYYLTKLGMNVPSWFCVDSIDEDQIFAKLDQDFKDVEFFAVRSSAQCEDSVEQSFAGQFATKLFVKRDNIISAIKECFDSAKRVNVAEYSQHDKIEMSVVIQTMISSQVSGVLFTINPLGSNYHNEICINAGMGLGEGVVSDKVATDQFFIDKKSLHIVMQKIVDKDGAVIFDKENGEGVTLRKQVVNTPALNRKELRLLCKAAKEIEAFYKYPQDIEWLFDENMELFITQARPVTTFNGKKEILDNSNIVESFPGMNTPLTMSMTKRIYSIIFGKALERIFPLHKKEINKNSKAHDNLLGFYKGRIFYNLTNWYEMMRFIPFTENYIRTWEKMMGIVDYQAEKKVARSIPILKVISVFASLLFYFFFLGVVLRRLDRRINKIFCSFWNENIIKFKTAAPMDMIGEISHYIRNINMGWELPLINDIYAFVFSGITRMLLKKMRSPERIFNDLLGTGEKIESFDPLKSILGLVDMARENSSYQDELRECCHNRTPLSSSEFKRKFSAHINLYGDRGPEDLKVETQTFRENPWGLMEVILDYLKTDLSSIGVSQREHESRCLSRKEVRCYFRFRPLRYLLLIFSVRMARRSVIFREKFRLQRSRGYGIARRMINIFGDRLAKANYINDAADIYYLTLDELESVFYSQSYDYDLKEKVSLAQEKYNSFAKEEVGERYLYDGKAFSLMEKRVEGSAQLFGDPCSSGTVTAEVMIVNNPSDLRNSAELIKDKILVAPMTDPGWVFLMSVSRGLIVEKGSILSHSAIIGRELGLPTIVGVKNATKILKNGQMVQMNGESGEIIIVESH